jgi:hypothetical protein
MVLAGAWFCGQLVSGAWNLLFFFQMCPMVGRTNSIFQYQHHDDWRQFSSTLVGKNQSLFVPFLVSGCSPINGPICPDCLSVEKRMPMHPNGHQTETTRIMNKYVGPTRCSTRVETRDLKIGNSHSFIIEYE